MANKNCLEGIACPKCSQDAHFEICGSATFYVRDSGSEVIGDYQWEHDSDITCVECGHIGLLEEFETGNPEHEGGKNNG